MSQSTLPLHQSIDNDSSLLTEKKPFPEEYVPSPGNRCKEHKKSVKFSVLDIREYEIILGDHPGLSSYGPSLSLGWSYNIVEDVDLDFYEKQRENGRRKREEMLMPRFDRENLLRDFGYSRREIEKAEQERAKILVQRRKSMKMNSWRTTKLPLVLMRKCSRPIFPSNAAA